MSAFGLAGFWSAFKVFSKGMTRGDAYFHLLLAGCLVGGTLFAQGIGESLWQRHNSGVRIALLSHHACSLRVLRHIRIPALRLPRVGMSSAPCTCIRVQ